MSEPVRVLCEDFKHYICKFGKAHDLFNEFMAFKLGECWKLPTPDCANIIMVNEHIPTGISKARFKNSGFGSEYLPYAQEISKFFHTWENNQYDIGRIINKDDFLKIGLFDLWISNEDRNHNNSNLLINPQQDGYYFIAIDHVNIFNTGTLDKGLVCLGHNESILESDITPILFKNSEKTKTAIKSIEKLFPDYVDTCKSNLQNILGDIPKDWNIDIAEKEKQLQQLFNPDWLQEILKNFRLYIASNFV